jgi:tripartite ATP-independent transporter DctM subunit
MLLQAVSELFKDILHHSRRGDLTGAGRMSYELIAILMFSSMMLLLMTGQRVFGAIGFVAVVAALSLMGHGRLRHPFRQAMKLMNWYPLLTLPMFIFMGYVLSESKIADDLYKMFHVWMGRNGGLAIGTIGLMVLISAMNGLSVAGMAIGATIALPELLRRGYDKRMVTGVIQAGSSLGILVPPSVVLVLYAMIARQPVGQLWLAGVVPGLMMAAMFIALHRDPLPPQPALGPALPPEERDIPDGREAAPAERGLLPIGIFLVMMVPFINGWTSLVESSAIGAMAAFLAAVLKGRMTREVFENSVRNTLGISCMFMWIILAALAFGAVFDGLGAVKAIENLFTEKLGLEPWMILILMQLSLHPDGHVSRRHRHAGDRGAALRAAGGGAGLRPDLVWGALHDHHADRLHDAALRLQPVPDAGDGAAGNRLRDIYRSIMCPCRRDDAGLDTGDGVSANRALAAALCLRAVTQWRGQGEDVVSF